MGLTGRIDTDVATTDQVPHSVEMAERSRDVQTWCVFVRIDASQPNNIVIGLERLS